MSDIRETMKRTAHAAVLEGGGLDEMMALRADDCIFQMLPLSLGHPPRNNKEYREHFATIAGLFRNMKVSSSSQPVRRQSH